MSLSEDIQIAQMRSSMALALASSGAILSAPNSVSRLNVEPLRPFCGVLGADGQSRGACASADEASGVTVGIASTAATTRTGNRGLMAINLFSRSRAASAKIETEGSQTPVGYYKQLNRTIQGISRIFSPIRYPWRALNRRCVLLIT